MKLGHFKGLLAFVAAGGSVLGSVMAAEAFPKWFCVVCLAVSAGSSGVLALFTDVPQSWLDRFGPKGTPPSGSLTVVPGGAEEAA